MPHSLLGGASILLPLSFPIFAAVYFGSNRYAEKPLRESLGLLQFGVAVIPQVVAPVIVLLQLITHAGSRTATVNALLNPSHVVAGVVLSANIIAVSWLVSLMIFVMNVGLVTLVKER